MHLRSKIFALKLLRMSQANFENTTNKFLPLNEVKKKVNIEKFIYSYNFNISK